MKNSPENMGHDTSREIQVASEATMSLLEFCQKGDLEGVRAALQSGADVNTKDEKYGFTGLSWAVGENHNSVVELLLDTSNIEVNQRNTWGSCALHQAVWHKNIEGLKLLLNVPNVNIVDKFG